MDDEAGSRPLSLQTERAPSVPGDFAAAVSAELRTNGVSAAAD
jgi:hypothetical protein